jgi:hypothetical protein
MIPKVSIDKNLQNSDKITARFLRSTFLELATNGHRTVYAWYHPKIR